MDVDVILQERVGTYTELLLIERNGALFECMRECSQKVPDTADIVSDACLLQPLF